MNELILQDCPEFPGLIDLGSCSIHVIHNVFGKGLDKKFGSDLISIDCKRIKLQLQDKELVIGSNTRKVLKELPSDHQKHELLGIRSFFGTTVTELQQKLPLQNNLL